MAPIESQRFFRSFQGAEANLFGRWMRAREIAHTKRDNNRVVRPFAWGLEFIRDQVNGADPRVAFGEHTQRVMARSEDFYASPEINDWQLTGGCPAAMERAT